MTTASEHVRKFPGCRSTTLAYLIEREKVHAQLRKEAASNKPWYARLIDRVRGR